MSMNLFIAVPGMPDNVIRLCTVIVWQSPSEPNGNILSYDIEFMSEDPESQLPPNYVQSHSANEGFHLTTMVERSPGAKVRVSFTLYEPILYC